jgi:CheY-specific phosphatase CheX
MENKEDKSLVSKVLILDHGSDHDGIKAMCDACGLVGIKPQFTEAFNIMMILRSNIDLGGILLHENFNGEGMDLAREIHDCRPELPIFLRREKQASLDGLSAKDAAMFRCAFTNEDISPLRATIETSIFSRVYPNALVRGITEMTLAALQTLFYNCEVRVETPYLIKDRIIYGSVFSMITIESHWCRGYMMFQTPSKTMLEIIKSNAGEEGAELDFRELNNVLGEATNLVWGSFKNRYVRTEDVRNALMQTQVPIIINQEERYISFGSEDPQLCLKYTLHDKSGKCQPVDIMQRFVFNLNWSPEDFSENEAFDSLFDSGELEMF